MPDIGSTLREARMRAHIDISEFEASTKIRAKYLRALENEEWDLLPGPTYVKSFLRTYADALGLDGRLLIEEFKLRHERLSDVELQPIHAARPGDRRRRSSRRSGRGWAVAVVVVALIAALYFLGRGNDSSDNGRGGTGPTATTPATGSTGTSTGSAPTTTDAEPPPPRLATLRIVPTGSVYVCLKRAGGQTLLDGVELQPGDPVRTYRSKRFRLVLGNNAVRLRVNGRPRPVPAVSAGIAYDITRERVRRLADDARPRCSA